VVVDVQRSDACRELSVDGGHWEHTLSSRYTICIYQSCDPLTKLVFSRLQVRSHRLYSCTVFSVSSSPYSSCSFQLSMLLRVLCYGPRW
jgi:hypothetical protein